MEKTKKNPNNPNLCGCYFKKNQNKDFKEEKRHLENIIYKIVTTNNKFSIFLSHFLCTKSIKHNKFKFKKNLSLFYLILLKRKLS